MLSKLAVCVLLWLGIISPAYSATRQWPRGSTTRFYDFKIQTMRVKKLCNSNEIVTVNNMFPGPVVYAEEGDRLIVKVINMSPYNATIHWHGVRQILSCWSDGPSYITQCPITPGQSFTYEFTMVKQKGTFFWHAHVSWLRATVYGALTVYPKAGVPYPFPFPYEEHIIILGEYWNQDIVQLERQVIASGGGAPPADAYTINGHPGPNYNCSANDVYKLEVVPGKTYLLRLINAGLNTENFFAIANHKLTIVEADAEYTKPFTTDRVMLGPGQTLIVLVKADQPIGRYSMAVGPYISARNLPFQNITSVAYFQYLGATPNSLSLPARLPNVNDNLAVKTVMDGLKGLNTTDNVPKEIDTTLFVTIGLNINKSPNNTNGTMGASMNNVSFIKPAVSLLEAYYKGIEDYFTPDFPGAPLRFYDFVNGAPNSPPNDTNSMNGTRTKVIEYGTRVQIILQDTGTISTENHPIHLHDMNTIGVPVGGWAAIRFKADNPGVWFIHCHFDVHQSWGLATALIVKNGVGHLETLPHPPADLPRC
ncbi:LAC6 [Linum perenne]